ncbi:MAG TPA: roadblock/LC7 domain-containing protein [Anaerolineae bacterium]|nr:roadblock/LC7 domain-containing protein [Anaerolineae bacterium]HRU95004.1 roadblock/LC7 domain-containing protein [Anaerolineae bacterium]
MKEVQHLISQLGQQPGFSTVVLTDASGLSMATAGDLQTAQALAAIVAEVLRVIRRADERLEMSHLSEVMLLSQDAQQGVLYRQFEAGGRSLVLAMVIEPHHTYWSATSQVIREIQQLLQK